MEKNIMGAGREIPMDNTSLQEALARGPQAPTSTIKPEVPPMPSTVDPEIVKAEAKTETGPSEEEIDAQRREEMILPTKAEIEMLRAKYGSCRVVPMPFTEVEGKVQTFVLRGLTRVHWRQLIADAAKIADSKPDITADEIFQDKVVSQAVVWPPTFQEHTIGQGAPGLVPTLFGVVQQMGLFFNPESIMAYTFTI